MSRISDWIHLGYVDGTPHKLGLTLYRNEQSWWAHLFLKGFQFWRAVRFCKVDGKRYICYYGCDSNGPIFQHVWPKVANASK